MKRDKVDDLFSRYVRLLSGGYCKRCEKYVGLTQGLHCAHWQGRGKWTTRYERDNAQALCFGCHQFLDHHKEEKDDFFFGILGIQRGVEVLRLSDLTLKDLGISKGELKERVYEELKPKVELLEATNETDN